MKTLTTLIIPTDNQCDSNGQFLKGLGEIFLTKLAKILGAF